MNFKKYIFIFSGAFFLIIEAILFFYMHQKYLLMQKEVSFLIELRRDYRNILEKAEESLIKKKILFC